MLRFVLAALVVMALPFDASALTIWERIDDAYERRSTIEVLPVSEHVKAAEAARHLGKAWDRYQRLGMANALNSRSDVTQQMDQMKIDYGFIDIQPKGKGDLQLIPLLDGAGPHEIKAVDYANEQLALGEGFRGMLPVGTYGLGKDGLNVEAAGTLFQTVKAKPLK